MLKIEPLDRLNRRSWATSKLSVPLSSQGSKFLVVLATALLGRKARHNAGSSRILYRPDYERLFVEMPQHGLRPPLNGSSENRKAVANHHECGGQTRAASLQLRTRTLHQVRQHMTGHQRKGSCTGAQYD